MVSVDLCKNFDGCFSQFREKLFVDVCLCLAIHLATWGEKGWNRITGCLERRKPERRKTALVSGEGFHI